MNNKKPVNKRRSFDPNLYYPFPDLKQRVDSPATVQKELQNHILYGRARGQKMLNLEGIDRKLINVNNT